MVFGNHCISSGGSTVRIEYLEEFTSLAQNLSFTETANKLNLSQPTLSKHINSLGGN